MQNNMNNEWKPCGVYPYLVWYTGPSFADSVATICPRDSDGEYYAEVRYPAYTVCSYHTTLKSAALWCASRDW